MRTEDRRRTDRRGVSGRATADSFPSSSKSASVEAQHGEFSRLRYHSRAAATAAGFPRLESSEKHKAEQLNPNSPSGAGQVCISVTKKERKKRKNVRSEDQYDR